MSLQSLIHALLSPPAPSVGYVRCIRQVRTKERIAALLAENSPTDPYTGEVLDILSRFGAKGTFTVFGDTSENYPDPSGTKFDHYPALHQDSHGGALHCGKLIRHMTGEGHQLISQGYQHIALGKQGRRAYLGSFDLAAQDWSRIHNLMEEQYGYTLRFVCPPHRADVLVDGFTAYDVCDRLGYQYVVAFPEVQADLAASLSANPDGLCGSVIPQPDGPRALEEQLTLLKKHGYRVVTVEQLLAETPFADVGKDDPDFLLLCGLAETHAIAYPDNTLRLDAPMTWGELAMLLTPRDEALSRRWERIRNTGKSQHPYVGAMEYAKEHALIPGNAVKSDPVSDLPGESFAPAKGRTRREILQAYRG